MLKNYFKTAWRNVANNKFYSALNIIGLTVGLAVGMLILQWTTDELSYDRFNSKAGQIYQINTALGTGLSKGVYPVTPPALAFHGVKEIPGVQKAVRIMENEEYSVFGYGDKTLTAHALYVDTSFFTIFDYKLLKGNMPNLFSGDQSVVLTQSTARRFFGDADPVGKTLLADNKDNFVVSGVMADFPDNSSIKTDILFSTVLYNEKYALRKSIWKSMATDWGNYGWWTFLLIRPGASIKSVEDQLTQINIKNQPTIRPVDAGSFQLQPLTSIHLYAPDGSPAGMQAVKIFVIVALLILLIASINYINLSTARAMLRSKEVSVRKIIGAGRRQLILQFILETVLFFSISLLLAFGLIRLLMPLYNNLAGKQMHFDLLNGDLWKIIGVTILATLLASGIYPALLLSSFKPIQALKGRLVLGVGSAAFRKVLVVCQFVFSVGLIIATLVINRQLRYIQTKELGYDKSFTFSFAMRDMAKHYEAVRSELLNQPGIQGVASASRNSMNVPGATLDVDWDGKDPNQSYFIHPMDIDKNFLPLLKVSMAAGTAFSGSAADSAHFIINETAAREAGIKDPVGKRLKFSGTDGTIIGIVKDFHFASLREKIQPFIFTYQPVNNNLIVKTTGKDAPAAIQAVEKIWKQYNPGFPLEYAFLDERYDKLYKSDQRMGALFDGFTAVAIIISCLGLFGLATYSAHVKVKEIGIRKVLGASVLDITTLLSKNFIVLVMLSIFIATPIAWWAMNKWLTDFAYRVTIPWWVFAVAGVGALAVTLLTVSFQAIKAALANPVRSLRPE